MSDEYSMCCPPFKHYMDYQVIKADANPNDRTFRLQMYCEHN